MEDTGDKVTFAEYSGREQKTYDQTRIWQGEHLFVQMNEN